MEAHSSGLRATSRLSNCYEWWSSSSGSYSWTTSQTSFVPVVPSVLSTSVTTSLRNCVPFICLVLIEVIPRSQVSRSLRTRPTTSLYQTCMERVRRPFLEKGGTALVYLVTSTDSRYPVCVNSSCCYTCSSRLVPFHTGLFLYTGRVQPS